jgi:hypothetical protein
MSSLPPGDARGSDLLVSYSPSNEEEMTEAVVNAFQSANIDVFEKPTRLIDWVNADAFEILDWTGHPVALSTRIWNYWVLITAEEIRIYTAADLV